MCIVCEIKERMKTSVMEEGVQDFVLERVELMGILLLTFHDLIETIALGRKVTLTDLDDLRYSVGACFSDHDGAPQAIEDLLAFIAEQQQTKH